jgi:hypothetical protein
LRDRPFFISVIVIMIAVILIPVLLASKPARDFVAKLVRGKL